MPALVAAALLAGCRAPEPVRIGVASLGASRLPFAGVAGPIGFSDAVDRPRLVMGVIRGKSLVPADSVSR